jgi:hypothetical protein
VNETDDPAETEPIYRVTGLPDDYRRRALPTWRAAAAVVGVALCLALIAYVLLVWLLGPL